MPKLLKGTPRTNHFGYSSFKTPENSGRNLNRDGADYSDIFLI